MSTVLHAQTVTLSEPDARLARRELRRQIARLEARGESTPAVTSGPQLLSLGELEAVRDAMLERASQSEPSAVHSGTFDRARRDLEAMFANPAQHRGRRIPLAALGQPGCGSYEVKPRLGVIGRLAGWWEITLSSGCP